MVSPARAVFTDTGIACSLWVGFGTSWGWMSSRPAPTSGYCFFLLEVEGKLSLPHSPNWSSCLRNTSKMCGAVATLFLPTPRKTDFHFRCPSHGQRPYPLPGSRDSGGHASEFEPPGLDGSRGSCLSLSKIGRGGGGTDFRQHTPQLKFLFNLPGVS